ncbi:MAG TPA: TIGR03067 domain-containing protein [Chitinophagaceae bacterium]|nr:TIGR03067 domain-containing protein [Chitinophagaceae bacterium]
MKKLALLMLAAVFLGCSAAKKAAKHAGNFDGVWIPVRQELGGKALPASLFEKQKLTIADSNYTFEAESTDKGIVIHHGNKMDIYGRKGVNAGKHFTAIYKFEKEQLLICYNLKGDAYPASFETKASPVFFLSVFKKMP